MALQLYYSLSQIPYRSQQERTTSWEFGWRKLANMQPAQSAPIYLEASRRSHVQIKGHSWISMGCHYGIALWHSLVWD